MAVSLPIELTAYMSLPALGVSPESISFRNLTMVSDKSICIREDVGGARNIVIVDVASRNIKHKKPMAAEAAIMNPDGQTIAVRAAQALQMYNLELGKKVKSHKMPEGSPVQFWTWISANTVGIVTDSEVFHWSVDGEAAPVKMFDRHASLAGTQVINYAQSADGKWLMAVGIKANPAGGPALGCMQLYSVEKKISQKLDGHAGCFTTAKLPGRSDTAILFCFVQKKPDAPPKLNIIEVGKDRTAPGGVFRLAPKDLPMPPEAAADFPVSMQVSKRHDVLYIATKMGFLFLYDIHTGDVIFRHRISTNPVFATVPHEATGGLMAVTAKAGEVLLVTINEGNLVPYIADTLRNKPLAMALAGRLGLGGASGMYEEEFNRLIAAGDVDGAAKLAATSPGGALRTTDTIRRFQELPQVEGQQAPVLKYFALLMEKGRLNKHESVELARPALAQGRAQLLDKWLKEDKIECSEELGDMAAPYSPAMALNIYLRAGDAHEKVVNCYVQMGEFTKIVPYATQHRYTPNYPYLLQSLLSAGNAKAAQEMASQLVKNEGGPLVDTAAVVDLFQQFNRLQECTSFLLEVLAGDKPEEGYLQTRLLEMNLISGTSAVVEAILSSDMLHHFDKPRIAGLCEKAGLFQRAMELHTDLADVKRCVVHTNAISSEFLTSFFGTQTTTATLECLNELLTHNPRANLQVVVQIATQYSEQLTPEELIKLFEAHKSWEGLYYFLGAIVNTSESPLVHFKYIQAAAELKQYKEVERVCRDSTVYDPAEVKQFLRDAKLPDPRPLIHVCDRHDYVDELTRYLVNNKLLKFVEVYVQKVSPQKTPAVIGTLLDLDQDEEFIKNLLNSVRHQCPVDPLVEEVETRNRLRMLQPWLEQRIAEGNTEPATHNAIGKIYITLNKDPQTFLTNNQYYDPMVVGRFCEKLDPYLAYLAYRRTPPSCDEALIDVTNRNALFKDQARYLVERQDEELWGKVLTDDNPHRRELIDQVTGTALPESKNPDEVSTTVRAFMTAELPNELIGLLEKLVLQGSDFAENRNLQNLLILTSIKCAHEPDAPPGRTMDLINRLDQFDGPEIAKIAVRDEYELYEEAFTIYKKFNFHEDAADVLIGRIENLDRAFEYAERVNEPAVWSKLAKAQLDAGMAKKAVDSYIWAKDPSNYNEVISVAESGGKFEDLVRFLNMARETLKERHIDSELVYSLAQTDNLAELETFVTSPNVAEIQSVGDRCFDEELYKAARLLFSSISNNAKLASTLIRLEEYREAVEAAKRANSVRSWKEVNAACVTAGEFQLAQQCGLHIIVSPDHLEELIMAYERVGHSDHLISLLESGLGQENAHQGIFTELGILYSKYRPEKLMEHIKIFWKRVNVSKLLRAIEAGHHWEEAAFLYIETEEYDQAVRVMTDHSPSAFDADKFLEIIQKVRNQELYYRAIAFYLEEEPLALAKLLQVLTPKLDHSRVVNQLRKSDDNLPLILPYLRTVQREELTAVNEAVNEILTREEDFDGLRDSITEHPNFDQLGLAQQLERHELLEMRRIAALLFKRNKRWEQSISLSKSDNMLKDAIDTAAESGMREHAEGLLEFFVEKGDKECFAACLFSCYSLIRPDVALELAWRSRTMDYVMPYMIQFLRHSSEKLEELDARTKPKEESKEEEEATRAAMEASAYGFVQPGGIMAISNVPFNAPADPYASQMGAGPGMAPGMGMPPNMGMPPAGPPGVDMYGQPMGYQ